MLQAMGLLPCFPSLQELHLGANQLTSLAFDQTLCPQLTNLKVPPPPPPHPHATYHIDPERRTMGERQSSIILVFSE